MEIALGLRKKSRLFVFFFFCKSMSNKESYVVRLVMTIDFNGDLELGIEKERATTVW